MILLPLRMQSYKGEMIPFQVPTNLKDLASESSYYVAPLDDSIQKQMEQEQMEFEARLLEEEHRREEEEKEKNKIYELPKEKEGRRKFVPYVIDRPAGVVAYEKPKKKSSSNVIRQGSKIQVRVRKLLIDEDNEEDLDLTLDEIKEKSYWLYTDRGWITEKLGTVGNIRYSCTPFIYGQPIGASISRTMFESAEVVEKKSSKTGWSLFGSSEPTQQSSSSSALPNSNDGTLNDGNEEDAFQVAFIIDIQFQKQGVLKLKRTYAEVDKLRLALLRDPDSFVKTRALKSGKFHNVKDGDMIFFRDPNQIVLLKESIESWLTKLLQTVSLEKTKNKTLLEFLTVHDADRDIINNELMAFGGINGDWPEMEKTLLEMSSPTSLSLPWYILWRFPYFLFSLQVF